MLGDAHIHLDVIANGDELAAAGVPLLATSCEPAGYERLCDLSTSNANVHPALGLHPWWIAGSDASEQERERFEAELQHFLELAPDVGFIGEVGLDFYGQYAATKQEQLAAFQCVAQALSGGGKVISLHTRNATGAALDALEEYGVLSCCTCILHGFNGSSTEMTRAMSGGCFFSVGARELKTKRWKEYARQLPAGRLLLETDAPWTALSPGDNERFEVTVEEWQASLQRALELLNSIRQVDMTGAIEENLLRVLS